MAKDRDRKVAALRRVALFRLCSDKELADIAGLADEASIKAGQVLTAEGKPGQECFVIADGSAEVTIRGEKIAIVGEGDAVGEMALLDTSPRSATVTALTDMQVFVLEPVAFGELLLRHPKVAKGMLVELARRLREQEHAPRY